MTKRLRIPLLTALAAMLVFGLIAASCGGSGSTTVAHKSAVGTELWVARYSGAGGDNSPSSLAVSGDGRLVFVTGASSPDTADPVSSSATVAYSAAPGAK